MAYVGQAFGSPKKWLFANISDEYIIAKLDKILNDPGQKGSKRGDGCEDI